MRAAALLLLACALPAQADELLGGILKRLGEPAVVRAQFVQERLVTDMTRPTVSRGRIAVSRRDGLLWRIESPLRLTLAFTPTAIIETGPDGVRRLRGQGRGVDTQIGRVLRGILGADEPVLRESFEATATGGPERWSIRLAPRPREMARVLREIRLGGGRHLESIEVEETAGNLTTIRMRQFSVAERLEPDELEFFKAP
jgi:hypothetical protein